MEKEEGTFEFLRALPIPSIKIFLSKLALTIAATAGMFLVLWCITLFRISPEKLPQGQATEFVGFWLVAAVEIVAWGIFFSLITARPLLAVVLTFAAASLVTELLVILSGHTAYDLAAYVNSGPLRLAIAAAVLCVDVYLGLRWLQNRPRIQKKSRAFALPAKGAVAEAESIAEFRPPVCRSRRAMLWRLLWQYGRHSAWISALLAALCVALVGSWFWLAEHGASDVVSAAFFVVVFASLMGSFVFRIDQERRQFRFFAEHNAPPRYVWLAREVPWLLWLAVMILVLYVIRYRSVPFLDKAHGMFVVSLASTFAGAVIPFAAGQWLSMLVPSGILAGFFSLVLTGLIFAWAALMQVMGVSLWWSVLPIPLVLFFATWLRPIGFWKTRPGSPAPGLRPLCWFRLLR